MLTRRQQRNQTEGVSHKTFAGGDVATVVSGSQPAFVYISDTALKELTGSAYLLRTSTGAYIFEDGQLRFYSDSANNRIYSPSLGNITLEALTLLRLGRTGADVTVGAGSADTVSLRRTTGTTAVDLGSSSEPFRNIWADGDIAVQPGTATSTWALGGGTMHVNTTSVGNVGAGEDDLMTYSLPANSLAADLDYIHLEMSGTFAATGANKRVRAYFGSTVLIDTTAVPFSSEHWTIESTIVRTSGTTQRAKTNLRTSFATVVTCAYATPGETLSGAVTVKCTGEATSNNDITQTMHVVQWWKGQ